MSLGFMVEDYDVEFVIGSLDDRPYGRKTRKPSALLVDAFRKKDRDLVAAGDQSVRELEDPPNSANAREVWLDEGNSQARSDLRGSMPLRRVAHDRGL